MTKEIECLRKILGKLKSRAENNFFSFYWNLWEDNDESVGTDYCFGFTNTYLSQLLISTLSEVGDNRLLFYSDFGVISDEIEVFTLGKSVEEFVDFQLKGFLLSGLTTKFYIFDSSCSWIIHVDESVLFSAEKELFLSLVHKMGGRSSVLESMKSDLINCSGEAKVWREAIIKKFNANLANELS